MTARTTILNGADYSLHAQLSPLALPVGGFALTITSQRVAVRNPAEEQVRFFCCFEREGLERLKRLIEQQLRIDPADQKAGIAGQEAPQCP